MNDVQGSSAVCVGSHCLGTKGKVCSCQLLFIVQIHVTVAWDVKL